jgi:hypothetical protein
MEATVRCSLLLVVKETRDTTTPPRAREAKQKAVQERLPKDGARYKNPTVHSYPGSHSFKGMD